MKMWTEDGQPIPYPTGQVSPCVLCGVAGGATWDELVLCGKCEGEMVESLRDEEGGAMTCKHCDRVIVLDGGAWVDPEASGDDLIWRETCDSHDTFVAEHEPAGRTCCDCGETFTPLTDHAIRCRECAAVKYLG